MISRSIYFSVCECVKLTIFPGSPRQSVVLSSRTNTTSTLNSPTGLQTVRATGSPLATAARTIPTTTLTAAQLQQLAAARGQVFSALQNHLKTGTAVNVAGSPTAVAIPGGTSTAQVRQVAVSQVAGLTRTGQLVAGQLQVRQGQAGLLVSQPARPQTITVQRSQQMGIVGSAGVGRPGIKQQVVVGSPQQGEI